MAFYNALRQKSERKPSVSVNALRQIADPYEHITGYPETDWKLANAQMAAMFMLPGYIGMFGGKHGRVGVIPKGTSSRVLRSHPKYALAKSGEPKAAASVVKDLIKPQNAMSHIQEIGQKATYVPVISIEQSGRNKLPIAAAAYYARISGGNVSTDIVQTNRAYHTQKSMMSRLLSPVKFTGNVVPGRKYVLVDDVITTGGTLRNLKNYIESKGGSVSGVVALTNASRGSTLGHDINLPKEIKNVIRSELGINPDELTRPEALYFRKFRDADSLRDRISKERSKRSSPDYRESPVTVIPPPNNALRHGGF